MSDRAADRGARLIFALRFVDRAYTILAGARSTLVLALAPDAVLDRYNDRSYSTGAFYRPDSADFSTELFRWERQTIERFFPSSPANILIGAAGGGREAFALAKDGYEIVAFEPAQELVEAAGNGLPRELGVRIYRARYADLPRLSPARPGAAADNLEALGRFDAAIMGWGSFSHLRSEAERIATLRTFAKVTRGPVLISFYMAGRDGGAESKLRQLRRLILKRSGRMPEDQFSINMGFYHRFTAVELARLVRDAGLKLVYLNPGDGEDTWPHAVLVNASP